MTLPKNLFLVRHGESEGNIATGASKRGDDRHYTEEFLRRHSSEWRLTGLGLRQAESAGAWLRENVSGGYVSNYIRALETAANLDLEGILWRRDQFLHERSWGDMDVMTHAERQRRYAESLNARDVNPFYWIPPNGEAIAELVLRMRAPLETIHRECGDLDNVVIVAHGEVMWALRVALERITPERYLELDRSKSPFDRIHNCQIIQYTRGNPHDAGAGLTSAPMWMRSVCPSDLTKSSNTWKPIERQLATNDDLRRVVERVPRMISE
jgi:broad specificity phosphatase PhoE